MVSSTSRILRNLSREEAFYFFASIGNYAGESVASLKAFFEKIGSVNVKSLEFHLQREDFEKWINETLGDQKLAAQIKDLRSQSITGENLRNHLCLVVARRYKELSSGSATTM